MAIREHTTLDASEPLRRGNHSHVLATPEAMAARFADHPEAVAETERLADTLRFDLTSDLGYRYPGAEDAERRPRAGRGLPRRASSARYPLGHRSCAPRPPRAWRRSCALIAELGLSGFFLLHHEMLELAREVAVEVRGPRHRRARCCRPGAGAAPRSPRSSATSPGLSHVDPIANKLLLGRFLNEEHHGAARHRPRLPARRARGPDPARARALRARPRGARRRLPDLPRARRDPRAGQGARAAAGGDRARRARRRRAGSARGRSTADIADGAGRPDASAERPLGAGWRALAEEAHGLPRHLSQHSGGMIVATRPLIDCCPVVPAAMEGRQMVMWDKDSCADAGFLKIDLLGLGMLSAVERCVELDRRAPRRADRPLAHPLRRPADLRGDPGGRDHRRLPDREPRADGVAAAHAPARTSTTSRSRWRSCARGRSRAARSTPTSSAASACARTPATRSPTTIPRSSPSCATRWGRSSSRTRSSRSRWPSRASRRARPRGCAGR